MRKGDYQHTELGKLTNQRPGPSKEGEAVQRSDLARGEMGYELTQPPEFRPAPLPGFRGQHPHAKPKNKLNPAPASRFDS